MDSSIGQSTKSLRGSRFIAIGLILFGLAGLAGLASLLTVAVKKVQDGKGFETYRTFWLVEFSYVGFLVLFVCILVAVLVGLALSWREERQWRAFEKKYQQRKQT